MSAPFFLPHLISFGVAMKNKIGRESERLTSSQPGMAASYNKIAGQSAERLAALNDDQDSANVKGEARYRDSSRNMNSCYKFTP
jgi:hypothetical protein